MNKTVVLFLISLLSGAGLFAQPLVRDFSYQPFFSINTTAIGRGDISDVLELPSGNLLIAGGFNFYVNNPVQQHGGITSTLRNGNRNYNFVGFTGGGGDFISLKDTDSVLANGGSAYALIDTNGNYYDYNSFLQSLKTVQCRTGIPYFYQDGSALMANGTDNSGQPCKIVNPPDTFPGKHIVKVSPDGLWDSTFTHDASGQPYAFYPYDSNRILIAGLTRTFTHYDGTDIDGMCRIYLDGTLDTTFHSPIEDIPSSGLMLPEYVDPDGKIFLTGRFKVKGHPNQYQTLVRLNPDGSLDTSFANFAGPTDSFNIFGQTAAICPTPDGGYLVGGAFDLYQGYWKKSIAKIDSNGLVEPQYFTNGGADSSIYFYNGGFPGIGTIIKSKFGGYYIAGDFKYWEGQPSQPIVRLTDLLVGTEQTKGGPKSLILFPNPTSGLVKLPRLQGLQQVKVYNMQGKLMQTLKSPNRTEVDLSAFGKGIYLIKLQTEDGSIRTGKVVRE